MPAIRKSNPRVILVLGGARSGKSRYAQQLAERSWRHPCYLATSEILDDEMADRVRLHRSKRGRRWGCIEEPLEVARAIGRRTKGGDGLLLDCITLWLSNVMLKEGVDAVPLRKAELRKALRATRRPVILVSNEVGMGIVPENALARQFRDQAGWLNQELAEDAGTVVFVAAGIPLVLKGKAP